MLRLYNLPNHVGIFRKVYGGDIINMIYNYNTSKEKEAISVAVQSELAKIISKVEFEKNRFRDSRDYFPSFEPRTKIEYIPIIIFLNPTTSTVNKNTASWTEEDFITVVPKNRTNINTKLLLIP